MPRSYYFPSAKKLLASFRLRSREFLRENTLHGFPYFVNPRRPQWERIFWFAATMSSICAAIGIICTIYQTFQSVPTLTGLDTETEEVRTYFPSLTLCPMYPNFTMDGLHPNDSRHYASMYHWSFQPIKDWPHDKSVGDEGYSQFYYRVLPECEDLFSNCVVGGKQTPCQEYFQKMITVRGMCCISEHSPIINEAGVRGISFDVIDKKTFPISLDFMETGPPGRRNGAAGYVLKMGVVLKIAVIITSSAPGVLSLPRKQRKCNTPEDQRSYSTCINKCQRAKLLKKCGCLPWFRMLPSEMLECKLAEYNCIAANVSAAALTDCNCYLNCNHTGYNVEWVQFTKNNRISISIPNWPTVAYRREVRFSWLDLLASFGGIAGLFVGYSLLTSVELGYYLTLRTYCGAVMAGPQDRVKIKAKRSRKNQQRRVIQVIDLKKDYYNYIE